MSTSPPPGTSPFSDADDNNNEDEKKDIESPTNREDSEDLMNDMAQDYEQDVELDEYEEKDLDPDSYEPMSINARHDAERLLNIRDRRENRGRRLLIPHVFADDDEDIPLAFLPRRAEFDAAVVDDEQAGDVNLEDYDGPTRLWLMEERVRREIKLNLKLFLTQYCKENDENADENTNIAVYPSKISEMCQDNRRSLIVDCGHLSHYTGQILMFMMEHPQIILEIFDQALMEVVQLSFRDYANICPHIHVRISHFPIDDNLRDLRQSHLNGMLCVEGVVTQRTPILPQLLLVRYDCIKCGYTTAPISQMSGNSNSLRRSNGSGENRPKSCPECQSSGPFRMNEAQSIFRNFQKIVLQEAPGSVGAGLIPRSRDVYLMDDLCDRVKPGEKIKVTGIYKNIFDVSLNAQQGFPVFSTIIEANHISKAEDFYSIELTDEDRMEIINLSKDPRIEQIIIDSIAPSIYGYTYIKRAIAYALFGGMEKTGDTKHRIRGDINMLILGDPGCGKSQFLKYVMGVAFRAVYATGKGASAVGLTAAVSRDVMTGEWTLHGGALVMADRGICLIDEFDKMNEHDRTSIHEAMEQQSISISKAGIVATLHARCSVIAAANPIRGRYDGSLTFVENVDLTDPLLSRFDVLAVVRDRVDPIRDETLASFVIGNHIASHPTTILEEADAAGNEEQKINVAVEQANANKLPSISQTLLRKYIMYAKRNCKPKLDNIDQHKIASFYGDLRQKSMEGGGIPIAVRHVESLLRLSEARAKMHLREYVNDEDVNMAIRVILKSFIDTQKQSVQTTLRRHYKRYLSYRKDINQLLMHILQLAVSEEKRTNELFGGRHARRDGDDIMADYDADERDGDDIEIDVKYFEQRVKNDQMQINRGDFRNFYQSAKFRGCGFSLSSSNQKIVIHF